MTIVRKGIGLAIAHVVIQDLACVNALSRVGL